MTAYISSTAANIIGIIGSILFLIAFAHANMAAKLNQIWFNALNFVGAILLLISLSIHYNLAAFLLEVCWGAVALFGLARAMIARRAAGKTRP